MVMARVRNLATFVVPGDVILCSLYSSIAVFIMLNYRRFSAEHHKLRKFDEILSDNCFVYPSTKFRVIVKKLKAAVLANEEY